MDSDIRFQFLDFNIIKCALREKVINRLRSLKGDKVFISKKKKKEEG